MTAKKTGNTHAGTSLTDKMREHTGSERRVLNPDFVEWMMSFPPKWTIVDERIAAAVFGCKPSATRGASSKRKRRSRSSAGSEVTDAE